MPILSGREQRNGFDYEHNNKERRRFVKTEKNPQYTVRNFELNEKLLVRKYIKGKKDKKNNC